MKDVLNYLKERIRDKMQSWRNRLLKNTVKDVLIKSVVTTLPTYVMSVFELPATWCEEINSMSAKFWWVANNEDWKIHWKRWKTMTVAKKEGGFKFQKLHSFNSTLLTNSATKVLSEPNTLGRRF